MPNSKAKRTPKQSKGLGVKHTKAPQSSIALILMGKGKFVGVDRRWAQKR